MRSYRKLSADESLWLADQIRERLYQSDISFSYLGDVRTHGSLCRRLEDDTYQKSSTTQTVKQAVLLVAP
jgi:hypothetical protein